MRVLELLPTFIIIVAPLLLIPFTGAQARAGAKVHVECAAGRGFEFLLGKEHAVVELEDRRLILHRRPSSLGQQFRTNEATLIIDGDFVAFVLEDDLEWQDCHIVVRPPGIQRPGHRGDP